MATKKKAGGSAIDALKAIATSEVEVGGVRWRIRKINTRLQVQAGQAMLALVPVATEGDAPPPSRLTERAIAEMAAHQQTVVAAGVTAASLDGAEWEDVEILTNGAVAGPGQLHVDQLPPMAEAALFTAIMDLSTDGGKAASRLATFRRQP